MPNGDTSNICAVTCQSLAKGGAVHMQRKIPKNYTRAAAMGLGGQTVLRHTGVPGQPERRDFLYILDIRDIRKVMP